MRHLIGSVIALVIVGCASSGPSPGKDLAETVDANAVEEKDDSSRVLNKTQCPKQGKIVNGKCTLSVESDE
jgi:hypothetical protein